MDVSVEIPNKIKIRDGKWNFPMITDQRYMMQCGTLDKNTAQLQLLWLFLSLQSHTQVLEMLYRKNFGEGIPKAHSSALQPIDFQLKISPSWNSGRDFPALTVWKDLQEPDNSGSPRITVLGT